MVKQGEEQQEKMEEALQKLRGISTGIHSQKKFGWFEISGIFISLVVVTLLLYFCWR